MSIIAELRRRNVFRVGAAYVVGAWLVIQVVETILPAFGFGDAAVRYVTIAFAAGLLPVLVAAWVFELTPEGLKRESELAGDRPSYTLAAKRLDSIILLVLALSLGYFAFDKFVVEPEREVTRERAKAAQLAAATEKARAEGRTEALLESYGDQSIAVLPFTNMSSDPEQAFFSEGIAEEILNLLAQVPELRVISRSSSFAFKGQSLEIPEVAKRLKVAHVLEGSVRKAGDTVRITAQLIEAASDTHLWSQTWDRELVDIFAIQDEIAAHVVKELQLTLLTTGEPVGPAVDPRAFEAVLRGRHLLHRLSPESATRAVPIFEEAIELAPDYAAAHAGLAEAVRQGGWPENISQDEYRALIGASVANALELDPDESQALAIKGYLNYWATDQPNEEVARALWRRAIKSNPSNSDALRWLAQSYQDTDALKYLETMREAYRVDPTRWITNYVLTHTLSDFGRHEEAIVMARAFHEMDPASIDPILWYGDVQLFRGNSAEALKAFFAVYLSQPPESWKWSATPWALLDLDQGGLMEAWSRELDRHMPGSQLAVEPLAVSLFIRGRVDQALQVVQEWEGGSPDSKRLASTGVFYLQKGDYDQAVRVLESALTRPGSGGPEVNAVGNMPWFPWMHYTMALKLAGQEKRAAVLLSDLIQMLHALEESGVIAREGWSTHFLLGAFYAQAGEPETAIGWLQKAVDQDVRLCASCLGRFRQFDPLRGDPRFAAVESRVRDRIKAQRRRLADEGMLLTPAELSALEAYGFDPFAEN